MDDGAYSKINGTIILCTDSFYKEDALRLINILVKKFNLSCGLIHYNKIKNIYRIRINKSSITFLISLVKPQIIPSMYYKFGIK